MPIIIIVIGVLLLLLLITVFDINAFIAFVLVSLFVGIAQGLPIGTAVDAIQTGMGKTLGSLVLILGFGAMLGKLVAMSGAAQQITQRMVELFGVRRVQIALMITGFIVGIPMFYSVGFVILVPLVFTVAASTGLPLLYVALPMLASLSVTHGFLPPHPAPTAVAQMFGADIGLTMLYGLILAVPAILVIIPLSQRAKKYKPQPLDAFFNKDLIPEEQLPPLSISLLVSLSPVILIGISAILKIWIVNPSVLSVAEVLGNPSLAMLIAVLLAIYFLGMRRGEKMKPLMDELVMAVSSITMVLLIIGGAGALKEVLVESGSSDYIGDLLQGSGFSPLLLAWLIAALIRVAVGSATVAGLTAAGIMLPMVGTSGVAPELMVLAIGAGSIFFSHVNDGGFWLFKEYFNLSVKDTLATWTVLETAVSVVGLLGVLVLNWII